MSDLQDSQSRATHSNRIVGDLPKPLVAGVEEKTAATSEEAGGGTDAIVVARPSPQANGAYGIWPTDKDGNLIGDPAAAGTMPVPTDARAFDIYFGIREGKAPPPKDQGDLQIAIASVLGVVQKLYCSPQGDPLPQFRLYYTRLYRLAELGLEDVAAPDIANAALGRLVDDLIDAEGGKVKNAHLAKLGQRALALSAGFVLVYLVLAAVGPAPFLAAIDVDPTTARSFMMLWTGCFAGVWLSYAIRTTNLTLRDLVVTDSDRLFPLTRLLFAGLLTMSLGILVEHGVFDLTFGRTSVSEFTTDPSLGLLIGILCGVSELTLPTAFAKRAGDFASRL